MFYYNIMTTVIVVPGLNNSVIGKNPNCSDFKENNNKDQLVYPYLGLINLRKLRQRVKKDDIPNNFTIIGRLSGQNIKFNTTIGPNYEDYKMRRKAEVLKYRNGTNAPGISLSNRQSYNNIVKNGGSYSSSRLKQVIAENNGFIPEKCLATKRIWKISTPSQSGVPDYKTPGYYLDPYITYYKSL